MITITQSAHLLVEISSPRNPTLYYSDTSMRLTVGGVAQTVLPFISKSAIIGYSCNPRPNAVTTPGDLYTTGFSLSYTSNILYDVAEYYASDVKYYLVFNKDVNLDTTPVLLHAVITDIQLTESETIVTTSQSSIFFDYDIEAELNGTTIPVAVGTGSNFGCKLVDYDNKELFVVSSLDFNITGVYNENGDALNFTVHKYGTITGFTTTDPVDSRLRVEGNAGFGTVGDLIVFLLSFRDLELDANDKLLIDTMYPETGTLQLFEKFTLYRLMDYILKSLNLVWFIDPSTRKVRVVPFSISATANGVFDDNRIIGGKVSISYLTRPFKKLRLYYDLQWWNNKHKHLDIDNTQYWDGNLTTDSERPVIYSITTDEAKAQTYINAYKNMYSKGLGVMSLRVSLEGVLPLVGEVVTVNSKALGLHSAFFVIGLWLDFNDNTAVYQLVTV